MGIQGLRRLIQGKKVPVVTLTPEPKSTPKPIEKPKESKGKYLWLLDAGHGEDTPGKRSIKLEDGSQLFEWEYNRKVRDYLAVLLNDAEYSCAFITTEYGNEDMPLSERTEMANLYDNAIFISMHADAYGKGIKWQKPNGVGVWVHRDAEGSKGIAEIFVRNISESTGWKNRGVKEAGFYVTNPKYINCPSILTENGFYTNEKQCREMMTEEYQRKVAKGHFKAIKEIENESN